MLRANYGSGLPWRTGRAAGHREPHQLPRDLQRRRVAGNHGGLNNAAGFYQGEGGNLSVEIGPVAMAGCSTESLSNKFIDLLARA